MTEVDEKLVALKKAITGGDSGEMTLALTEYENAFKADIQNLSKQLIYLTKEQINLSKTCGQNSHYSTSENAVYGYVPVALVREVIYELTTDENGSFKCPNWMVPLKNGENEIMEREENESLRS